jgi:membrane protein YdbS with pleckstrin-like domain
MFREINMRFKTKLEWWFYAALAVLSAASVYFFIVFVFTDMYRDLYDIIISVFIFLVNILLIFLVIYMGFKLTYVITDTSLIIEHGKLPLNHQKILYEDIKTIEKLKSGRIMIKYLYKNRVLTGLLWVADREGFMKQINEKININI